MLRLQAADCQSIFGFSILLCPAQNLKVFEFNSNKIQQRRLATTGKRAIDSKLSRRKAGWKIKNCLSVSSLLPMTDNYSIHHYCFSLWIKTTRLTFDDSTSDVYATISIASRDLPFAVIPYVQNLQPQNGGSSYCGRKYFRVYSSFLSSQYSCGEILGLFHMKANTLALEFSNGTCSTDCANKTQSHIFHTQIYIFLYSNHFVLKVIFKFVQKIIATKKIPARINKHR